MFQHIITCYCKSVITFRGDMKHDIINNININWPRCCDSIKTKQVFLSYTHGHNNLLYFTTYEHTQSSLTCSSVADILVPTTTTLYTTEAEVGEYKIYLLIVTASHYILVFERLQKRLFLSHYNLSRCTYCCKKKKFRFSRNR